MNWELVKRDKDGELDVSIVLVCLIIVCCGFLFGIGLSAAYILIDSIYNGDGFYIYYFFKEYKIALIFSIIVLWLYLSTKSDKEKKK